jgi:hypothetical protein
MELSLTISMMVILRVKRSSKYSDACMMHREDKQVDLRGCLRDPETKGAKKIQARKGGSLGESHPERAKDNGDQFFHTF